YIILGAGLSELALASRLSKDSSVCVLVLEAGASGDDPEDRARIGTQYDWAHQTVPQANLGGRVIGWPRGKVLGGSTEMNAMYLVRPSSVEMDAWAELLGGMDNDGSGIPKLAIHAHRNAQIRDIHTFTR
ncbi:GMC oxidoreductase-domain-containing protein, partial [Cyathus striatus]